MAASCCSAENAPAGFRRLSGVGRSLAAFEPNAASEASASGPQ